MIVNPIIPIWLMVILCIVLLIFKRKGTFNYIRQIFIIILLFVINLRIMIPNSEVSTIQKNVDVLFVVDNTISMLAEDYDEDGTTRMEAVKKDCEYIMEQLPGSSFSVVSFGNKVNNLLPYTIDSINVIQALQSLKGQTTLYAKGTEFDDVLTFLNDYLNRENEHLQIVFFISDGEITNGNDMGSYPGLKDYIDGGAVLGYGTEEGGPMHAHAYAGEEGSPEKLYYYDSDFNRRTAISEIDEENLQNIASDMGIEYVHMTKQSEIDSVLATVQKQIAQMDSSDEKTSTVGYSDTFYFILIPLIPLLAIDFVYYKRKINF